ncbi:MAG: glycosyltransferase [Acidobacteriota bacterium]
MLGLLLPARYRYRLSSGGVPLWRSASAPEGAVEICTWLSRSMIWVSGWLTTSPGDELAVRWTAGERSGEASAARVYWSRFDLVGFAGAAAQVLVVPIGPSDTDESAPHDLELWVRPESTWYRWTRRGGAGIAPDVVEHLEYLAGCTSVEAFSDLCRFVVEQVAEPAAEGDPIAERALAAAHRLAAHREISLDPEPEGTAGADARDGSVVATSAAEALPLGVRSSEPAPEPVSAGSALGRTKAAPAAPRSELAPSPDPSWRRPLPAYIGDPALPFGLCLDRFLVLDDSWVFLQGWCVDFDHQVESFELVPAVGESIEIRDHWRMLSRPDVREVYRQHFGELAESVDFGFIALLPFATGTGAAAARQPRFELHFRDRRQPLLAAPGPAVHDPFLARHFLLFSLPAEAERPLELVETILAPALEALATRCVAACGEPRVHDIGVDGSSDPEVSLIVPLGTFEMVEPFLAVLSDDRALDETEIVFAIDEPRQARELETLLDDLSRLYYTPALRIVSLPQGAGIAASSHAAAQTARGELLLFLHDDVVPLEAGWLPRLVAAHREHGGLTAPRLLYEDGSIQSRGARFRRDGGAFDLWQAIEPMKGLPPSWAGARQSGEVIAASAACLMIDRALYEELGGYARRYAVGDFEDYDLCLRARAAGHGTLLCAEVDMVHLEGQTRNDGWGWRRNDWTALYNRWLFSKRHGRLLEELAAAAD